MEANTYITRGLLLPELKLLNVVRSSASTFRYVTQKQHYGAVCPKCAAFSKSRYDKRTVTLRDQPIHGKQIILQVTKHRYFCKTCKRPFTEPINGVMPKRQTT